jgi:uncharacterized membrane protein
MMIIVKKGDSFFSFFKEAQLPSWQRAMTSRSLTITGFKIRTNKYHLDTLVFIFQGLFIALKNIISYNIYNRK